jgi:SAM-dependent methyltransferase
MNFNNYAAYYNLLYRDKNYLDETDYVTNLLNKFSENKVEKILDLGCGTGKHASLFAEKGYKVVGVDLSEQMIEIANKNKNQYTDFLQADVRNVELNQKFDAVISLFHVASYQISNQDFENYLNTAYKHLKKGGLFIFDFWYGAAVLTDRPTLRVKRLENDSLKITRISEPVLHSNINSVDVNFEVLIEDKLNSKIEKIHEIHNMRYWFMPEIELFAKKMNFSILDSFQWLTEKELTFESWNGIVILKK